MVSGKKRWVFMVLLLVWAATSELGWCWGDAMANAKEHLNIANNWAQDKFAGGGVNKETTESVKEKASGAASDTSDKADQVGGQVRSLEEEESNEVKFDDLKNSYDDAMKKVGEHYNSAKDSFSEHSKNTYEAAKEHSQNTYEAAKEHSQHTYEAAKEHSQNTYEAAKEMAHDAAAKIN